MSAHKVIPYSVLRKCGEWKEHQDHNALHGVYEFFSKNNGVEIFIIPEPQTFHEAEVRMKGEETIKEIIAEKGARMVCAKTREAELLLTRAHVKAQEFTSGVLASVMEAATHRDHGQPQPCH